MPNNYKEKLEKKRIELKNESEYRKCILFDEQLIKLAEALDKATDLLHVPEHNQDDEWYKKEKEVHEALNSFNSWLDGK